MTRIVGVVLVRNEDRFLEQALVNAAALCDAFLLFDHGSGDRSPAILAAFAARHADARVWRIAEPGVSQEVVAGLAGADAWVFGVDGDEVYDPAGLAALRPRLLAGEFSGYWMVMGNCLHVEALGEGSAAGFLAPPSRSVTKLYNFAAISAWEGRSFERLHGGRPQFRPGYSDTTRRFLQDELPWEDSPLRCLHLCFERRSSMDATRGGPRSRANIAEIYGGKLPAAWARRLALLQPSAWKRQRYRRGPRVARSTEAFFPRG